MKRKQEINYYDIENVNLKSRYYEVKIYVQVFSTY